MSPLHPQKGLAIDVTLRVPLRQVTVEYSLQSSPHPWIIRGLRPEMTFTICSHGACGVLSPLVRRLVDIMISYRFICRDLEKTAGIWQSGQRAEKHIYPWYNLWNVPIMQMVEDIGRNKHRIHTYKLTHILLALQPNTINYHQRMMQSKTLQSCLYHGWYSILTNHCKGGCSENHRSHGCNLTGIPLWRVHVEGLTPILTPEKSLIMTKVVTIRELRNSKPPVVFVTLDIS